jgi:O-antigen/teichoic acid export membrane protein
MFSSAWLSPKVSLLGILVAQRRFHELDRLFWRLTKVISIITILATLVGWGAVYFLNEINHPFAKRMLTPLPTGIFLIAQLFIILTSPFSFYLRAHKKEPLIYSWVVFTLLVIFSNFTLGKYYSATGMAVGYLIASIIITPVNFVIWKKCAKRWRCDMTATAVKQIIESEFNKERGGDLCV